MKNYKDILDTSDLARGSYQGNTVELSYNKENIRYIINNEELINKDLNSPLKIVLYELSSFYYKGIVMLWKNYYQ